MAKNLPFVLIAAGAYTALFHYQIAGLNFLLFSAFVSFLLVLRDRTLMQHRSFQGILLMTIVTSASVFWYGTTMPILMNVVALFLLGGLSRSSQSSLPVALVHSVLSGFLSPIVQSWKNTIALLAAPFGTGNRALNRFALSVLPIGITLLFIGLYRKGSQQFDAMLDQLSLTFFSPGLLLTFFCGLWLMTALFKQIVSVRLQGADLQQGNDLFPAQQEGETDGGCRKLFPIRSEIFTGAMLLGLLNAVLVLVNVLDSLDLFVFHEYTTRAHLSDSVHRGTNALMTSVILASIILMFLFRGELNFEPRAKHLKTFAYLWIFQNAYLVVTTAHRNLLYIDGFGLTHRRIGVIVFLLTILIGLILVWVKVRQLKTNWYLLRTNSWSLCVLLSLYGLFNWDNIITRHNLSRFQDGHLSRIDSNHLLSLNHANLATFFQYYLVDHAERMPEVSSDEEYQEVVEQLWRKYHALKHQDEGHGWPSACVTKTQTLKAVSAIVEKHHLNEPDKPYFRYD
jgi:hypothetical protein